MIQLVIKNDVVLAWHVMEDDIDGKYPGAEVIFYDGPAPRSRDQLFAPDPRLSRDPRVQLKRPPSRVAIYDADGVRHVLTIGPESFLDVRKSV